MSKTIQYLSVMIICLSAIWISPNTQAEQDVLSVVCTNTVLADFTTVLLGENAEVQYIMPGGACPSHFDTCPSDVAMVAEADIIVSLGWEPWLSGLIESSGNTDAIQVKCGGLDEWNLPEGAIAHVEKLASGLGSALQDLNGTIQDNADDYIAEVNAKGIEMTALVSGNGLTGKPVICMEWQSRFVEWLGFDVVEAYSPPEMLSTEDMVNIKEKAEEEEIWLVIDNLQSGTDFGAEVAAGSGATHVILTNFPGGVPNTYTYLDMLEYNTEQLVNGAETYEYKQGEISELEDEVQGLELQRAAFLGLSAVLALLVVILFVALKRK